MEILLTVFVVLWLILSIISGIIINNNTLYCRIFEKRQYDVFQYMINHIDEIQYRYHDDNTNSEVFFLPESKYMIIVWRDLNEYEMASVHDINTCECYACSFVQKLSKQLAKLLLQKIK